MQDSKYHLELDPECKLSEGWSEIDCLAKEGLMNKIKEFNGTNYQEWAQKMEAYLKTQELWHYVTLAEGYTRPAELPLPAMPPAGATESVLVTFDANIKAYNDRQDELRTWDRGNDKALGIIQLKLHDKMQYLATDSANRTWLNIKASFNQQGSASIFVDFKAATNFQFNEKKEPAVQVAKLNNIVGWLQHRGFTLEPKIQAMLILTGLPLFS